MTTETSWLDATRETPLEPELPIIDPHHHLWYRPGNRYLLDELLADLAGQNVRQTVFIECSSMYRAEGPEEFRVVGETEFVQGVAAQSATCEETAIGLGLKECSGDAEHRGAEPGAIRLKAAFPPSELSNVVERVQRATVFPGLGVMFADLGGAAAAHDITSMRAFFERIGGSLVVERMPQELYGKIDAWGTPPPSFALMRALKERFDPARRLNPGRFVGGL